jgi:hypothetical protein
MIYEDPRERAPEIDDDQKKSQDHDKETNSEKEDKNDAYQYTDWASI